MARPLHSAQKGSRLVLFLEADEAGRVEALEVPKRFIRGR